MYLGKKQFFSVNKKKIVGRKNRKIIKKETKWREYTGSSQYLNDDIELFGKDNFKFEILSLHETKASWSYREIEIQILEDVLRSKLNNGELKYYNRQIGNAVKFIPPMLTEKEREFLI